INPELHPCLDEFMRQLLPFVALRPRPFHVAPFNQYQRVMGHARQVLEQQVNTLALQLPKLSCREPEPAVEFFSRSQYGLEGFKIGRAQIGRNIIDRAVWEFTKVFKDCVDGQEEKDPKDENCYEIKNHRF